MSHSLNSLKGLCRGLGFRVKSSGFRMKYLGFGSKLFGGWLIQLLVKGVANIRVTK